MFLDNGGGIHQPRVAEMAHDELDIRMADGGFIEGQRMAVFDECFGTGGLSGVDGNRLFIRLGEIVDRFEALVGNVDGIISRIEFDADAGIPF